MNTVGGSRADKCIYNPYCDNTALVGMAALYGNASPVAQQAIRDSGFEVAPGIKLNDAIADALEDKIVRSPGYLEKVQRWATDPECTPPLESRCIACPLRQVVELQTDIAAAEQQISISSQPE